MSRPALFAVTGKPVAHSLSPDIFRLFFRESGYDGLYTRLAADTAREALETAWGIGIRGLNVTSPFKEEMAALVDCLDEPAARIGAVNCVRLGGPRAGAGSPADGTRRPSEIGYNTDHIGLIGTLNSCGVPPAGRSALILGAGGAARAAAYGLIYAGASKVILANRSPEKAEKAARSLGCDWAALADARQILGEVDICVSCLPFPATRVLPDGVRKGVFLVDARYAGASKGALTPTDGNRSLSAAWRWLFHQAVPSFEIFTGLKVPGDRVLKIWEEFSEGRTPAPPRPRQHIALVGFMGTGKTTTGRQLAHLLGWDFVDTDETIEALAGLTVPEIFALRGESAFRAQETSVIEKTVSAGGGPKVISVGGGAVIDETNRRTLARACRTVWLWAPARTAVSRLDIPTRPVLDPAEPIASAERTLAARLPLYAAAADLIVNASEDSPLDIARRIKDEMDQAL